MVVLNNRKIMSSFLYTSSNKHLNIIRKIIVCILRLLILTAIGYIIIYPLLQMVIISIKDKAAIYDASAVWVPSGTNIIQNYSIALKALDYGNSLVRTLIYQVLSALIQVLTCSISAYGFARFKFKFKNFFTIGLFLTILIPDTMIIIPRVVNYAHLDFMGIFGFLNNITGVDLRPNILNSVAAFWVPSFFSIGLRSGILIYIYIQFFKGLPYELEEAAWVDGAGPIRTFVSIAMPSSSVVFTTVTVFSLIWHWNDTLLPSMYMSNNFTLSVMLEKIQKTIGTMIISSANSVEVQAYVMAGCVLFLIPPLLLYMVMQKRFIESIDRVGITG